MLVLLLTQPNEGQQNPQSFQLPWLQLLPLLPQSPAGCPLLLSAEEPRALPLVKQV